MDKKDEVKQKGDLEKKVSRKSYIKLSRIKRRILKHVYLVRTAIFLGAVAVIYLTFLLLGSLLGDVFPFKYAGLAKDFVFTPTEKIESIDGRTNILVLGKGGGTHDAPDLTDTIIFASVSHETGDITLVSLPRDIWIPALRAKLNSTYYWGNQKEDGGGLVLSKATVEEIVGQPIHYGVVIDFDGFKEIVDDLEGVEVDVQRGFVDDMYPVPGKENDLCDGDPDLSCRYETVEFNEGLQTMDGERALKFVRSRNAEGDEGTDIARAERQQQIINALIRRTLSFDVVFSPTKISKLITSIDNTVETDMSSSAASILARRAFDARGDMESYVLNEELLENPPQTARYDNLYVFIPKAGDWEEVHSWITEKLP